MDSRDQRLALNQTLFRQVNERVADVAHSLVADEPVQYEFFCECSDAACVQRLELTLGEYESLRATPSRFAIAPGHEYPHIEQLIRRNDRYDVVEKLEEAGEMAAARDPRA